MERLIMRISFLAILLMPLYLEWPDNFIVVMVNALYWLACVGFMWLMLKLYT